MGYVAQVRHWFGHTLFPSSTQHTCYCSPWGEGAGATTAYSALSVKLEFRRSHFIVQRCCSVKITSGFLINNQDWLKYPSVSVNQCSPVDCFDYKGQDVEYGYEPSGKDCIQLLNAENWIRLVSFNLKPLIILLCINKYRRLVYCKLIWGMAKKRHTMAGSLTAKHSKSFSENIRRVQQKTVILRISNKGS